MNSGVNNRTNIDWKGLSAFLIITFVTTSAVEGADTHCQLNNLPLSYQVVSDWLDEVF
jgi:hypothetical protein